jgi:hypothetical protein
VTNPTPAGASAAQVANLSGAFQDTTQTPTEVNQQTLAASGGGGGITDLTSTGSTVTITDATGPTTNIEVANPLAAGSLFETFSTVTAGVSPMVAGTLYTINGTGGAGFVLPSAVAGQIFGVVRGTNPGTISIAPPTGGTINGQSANADVYMVTTGEIAGQMIALIALTATAFQTITLGGTDGALGLTVDASLKVNAGIVVENPSGNPAVVFNSGTGSNTAATANILTPTLGAAAQLADTTHDAMVMIQVTTAGQLTVAIGPTSGVADSILNATAVAAGQLITLRLPAGWYIAVTSSSTAAWTATTTRV